MATRIRPSAGAVITRLALVGAALLTATLLVAPVATAAPATGAAAGMSPDAAALAAIIRDNEQRAFTFFVNQGLTAKQAAGVVGNLDQESGMDPTIAQPGGPGRGIAQWGVGGRWDTYAGDNLVAYANARGVGRYALSVQLNFTWFELSTMSYYGLSALRNAGTVSEAVTAFQNNFEHCDPSACNTTTRLNYARDAYNRYT